MPCYDFSGDIQNGAYHPCQLPTQDGLQPCCASNDTCLPNKLCSSPNGLYRGGCTDPAFKSQGCPQFCLSTYTVFVHDYGNSTGCCDPDQTGTCNCQPGALGALAIDSTTVQILTIAMTSGTSVSAISSSTTTNSIMTSSTIATTTISSTSTGASETQPVVSSNASSSATTDSSLGLKIGIPVAIVIVVAIIAAMWFFLRRRYRHQHLTKIEQQHAAPMQGLYRQQTIKHHGKPIELAPREPRELPVMDERPRFHASELEP